jgi:hypothetical protein
MTASTARTGQRVPNPPSQQATKTVNNGHQPPARPTATITTMIVCLPDGMAREPLTARHLDRHFGVSGTLQARFWAKPDLYLWQSRHLIVRSKATRHQPVYCAGGPARLLDLNSMRHAAGLGAGLRHQLWQQVVQGTKPAQPWVHFHTRHLTEPDKYSYEQAAADFWQQPRITAMRVYNAANVGTPLAVDELEMLQAGPVACQHNSAMTAICGDALLTADGRQLTPVSDAFADRVTYLEQAIRYLDTIADTEQRLIAVSL